MIGDSIINQLTEEGLSRGCGKNVKVFAHGGATTEDIKCDLMKVIPMKPSHIIIHAGTNNAMSDTSRHICNELLFIKFLITDKLPDCKVTISCPIIRVDKPKANLTLVHLNRHLGELKIDTIVHKNIRDIHLGRKGLHLNDRGTKQFAANFINHMQNL